MAKLSHSEDFADVPCMSACRQRLCQRHILAAGDGDTARFISTGAAGRPASNSMPISNMAAVEPAGEDDEDATYLHTSISEKGWYGAYIKSRLPFSSHMQKAGTYAIKGWGDCPSATTSSCITGLHIEKVEWWLSSALLFTASLLLGLAGAKHSTNSSGKDELQLQIAWPDRLSMWVDKLELHMRPHTHLSLIRFYESKTKPK